MDPARRFRRIRARRLAASLVIDAVGMVSYLLPLGLMDMFWGPLSGWLIYRMYGGAVGTVAGVVGMLEELAPATDLVPTATLTWLWVYAIAPRRRPTD